MNKDQGPQRFAFSSYGFLRTEPYQPHLIPGHREAEPVRDDFDGEMYVRAIDYFMLKVSLAPDKSNQYSDILLYSVTLSRQFITSRRFVASMPSRSTSQGFCAKKSFMFQTPQQDPTMQSIVPWIEVC